MRLTVPIFTAAPTYVFSHTFFKKQSFKKILGPFRGPPGHKAHISESLSSRLLPQNFFSSLSTSILTKGFTQTLPTSTAAPTPTPSSDPPPRVTYPTIFSRLSTSSLIKGFTQPLATSTVAPTPTPYSDSLLALRTLRFFPASPSHF